MKTTKKTEQPIPYLVTDLPVPYRVRVLTASPELRAFVAPKLGIQPVATVTLPLLEEEKSGVRMKVA